MFLQRPFRPFLGIPNTLERSVNTQVGANIDPTGNIFILCILAPFRHITLLLKASKGPQTVLLVNEDGPELPYVHLVGPKLHLGALIYLFPKSYFWVFLGVSKSQKSTFQAPITQIRPPKFVGPIFFLKKAIRVFRAAQWNAMSYKHCLS